MFCVYVWGALITYFGCVIPYVVLDIRKVNVENIMAMLTNCSSLVMNIGNVHILV